MEFSPEVERLSVSKGSAFSRPEKESRNFGSLVASSPGYAEELSHKHGIPLSGHASHPSHDECPTGYYSEERPMGRQTDMSTTSACFISLVTEFKDLSNENTQSDLSNRTRVNRELVKDSTCPEDFAEVLDSPVAPSEHTRSTQTSAIWSSGFGGRAPDAVEAKSRDKQLLNSSSISERRAATDLPLEACDVPFGRSISDLGPGESDGFVRQSSGSSALSSRKAKLGLSITTGSAGFGRRVSDSSLEDGGSGRTFGRQVSGSTTLSERRGKIGLTVATCNAAGFGRLVSDPVVGPSGSVLPRQGQAKIDNSMAAFGTNSLREATCEEGGGGGGAEKEDGEEYVRFADLLAQKGYSLGSFLGRSSLNRHSKVLTAVSSQGCSLAVKCVSESNELLEHEFYMLKELRHPNIVKVMDLVIGSDGAAMVMEQSPGKPLSLILNKCSADGTHLKTTTDEVMKHHLFQCTPTIVQKLLGALDYLHTSCSLVHRDLKAENVMVALEPSPKTAHVQLIDFGSSRHCEVESVSSPRSASSNGSSFHEEVDQRILPSSRRNGGGTGNSFELDMFALGLLMASLLARKQIFTEHIYKGGSFELPWTKVLPINEYLCRFLVLDPTQRMCACEALSDFEQFSSQGPAAFEV
eukprot:TRINITY_DN11785_c0_g1_i1.p1 TRINITY_DN11785_c0_g1~~TRINITY_DN11785_c0_g1_i1.p1  ORF type:complete len:638 (+),score=100.83 TRINITY_DN11785_c0_g1_i1:73-1986(+)